MISIYEHFASYTRLPIEIDDIRQAVLESGAAERIEFVRVRMNDGVLRGMLRMFGEMKNGSRVRVAQIIYSDSIVNQDQLRMVCCKELLHVLDEEFVVASTRDAVNDLIDHIVVPPEAGLSNPALSDHAGMVNALSILLPRDALFELRPQVKSGQKSVEEVAMIAAIPLPYARLALSDLWWKVIDGMNHNETMTRREESS